MTADITNKSVLIGLDGATYTILDPLMEAGEMPNLKALMDRSARAVLRSTTHPLTPPAWTTLMTGRTPGHHGIYDFVRVDREAETPSYTLASSTDTRAETIWSIASRNGLKVTTLNFPLMFPAPELNGFVIPGYVPWSYLGRAIRPRELYQRIKQQESFSARELSTDWEHERKAVQGLSDDQLDGWVEFHIQRERRWYEILMMLMREDPCELTAVLFDGVDRIQHLCYHLLDPAQEDRYNSADARRVRALCKKYFADLDRYIGDIVAVAGPEAQIVIASDHGFTQAGDKIFYINSWLAEHGYLKWAENVPFDDAGRVALDGNAESGNLFDWSGTTAFAFTSSSNGVYIRPANGTSGPGVTQDDYSEFCARLIAQLQDYKDPETGQRVVSDVMTAQQAFPGPHSTGAPDLTLFLADCSFQSVLRADSPLKPRAAPYGTHHPDGIFVAAGPGIRAGALTEPLSICDIAATVLYGLDLPIAEDMEGVVPTAAYDGAHLKKWPVRYGPPAGLATSDAETDPEQLPEEAEAQIRERLKALGYI